ncbi:MAG: DNA primase [Longimicrobiaceae bacterium]
MFKKGLFSALALTFAFGVTACGDTADDDLDTFDDDPAVAPIEDDPLFDDPMMDDTLMMDTLMDDTLMDDTLVDG